MEIDEDVVEVAPDEPFLAEDSPAFSEDPPARGMGRPRKDGMPQGSAPASRKKRQPEDPPDVSGPRFTVFYSDHHNPNQRTRAAWTWWNQLSDAVKGVLDAHVYRDWPTLLDPPSGVCPNCKSPDNSAPRKKGTTVLKSKFHCSACNLDFEDENKYVDKVIGSEPIQNDQDFVDRWGAGDYHLYLNANVKGDRRTLMTCYIKGSHDFRTYPPNDRRIQDLDNLSLNDPGNGAFVAWLRSTGKIKDEVKEAKEQEEMATVTAGVTDLLSKSIERGDRLMEKLVEDRTTNSDPPPEPPSAEETLNKNLTLLEKLQNFTAGKPTSDPIAMVTAVIEAAKLLAQSNNQNPASMQTYIDRIDQLQDRLRVAEVDGLKAQLSDIRAQLTAKESATPNLLSADGASLEGIVQRVVEKFMDKPEENPWLDVFKQGLPLIAPALNAFAARLMMPAPVAQPHAFPMPPATYQAGAPQQAQLPPPAQPQQQPTAQQQPQQGGAYTTGNPQLDALLMAVVIPLADCLRDGETGAVFADEFIETQGIETHAMLSQVGVEPIANILAAYPPLAGVMKKITREKLLRFVGEFCEYKPSEVPAGGAA